MSTPMFMNMPGTAFPFNNMMDCLSYSRGDIPVEIGHTWDHEMIDPSLQDTGGQMLFYPEWDESQQSIQRFLGEPQKIFFTASPMPSFQAKSFQMELNRPYEAPGPIPYACEPSQGSPSSICSSVTSPGTDIDWFHRRPGLEDCSLSRSTSHMSQSPPDLKWSSRNTSHSQIPMTGHINLREVQTVPDPEEVIFKDDEGFIECTMKMEYTAEVNNRGVKQERSRGNYRHSSDEGIGMSLKSEESSDPKASTIINEYNDADVDVDVDVDVDADGEFVDEYEDDVHEPEQPPPDGKEDQDTDYKPKASRNKRRRPGKSNKVSPSAPASKRNKVTKATSRSKSQFQCTTCHHSAKDAAALFKHVQTAHTRPYVCTFSFAGCNSTFGNKNEWKRHVTSQHLGLHYWLCDVGACSHSKSSTSRASSSNWTSRTKSGYNEFNRKDLFTQHLRRMHSPFPPKNKQKKTPDWESQIQELQTSCLKVRRTPPTKTKCPVKSCGQVFEGPTSWDDRMEHVGRHLEKASTTSNGATDDEIIEQESDEFMIAWALREKIIQGKVSGGYKLNKVTTVSNGEDGDADGEDE